MSIPAMLKKSILVVAHPDDEVLWFSSILDKADEVVFCYLDVKSKPKWTTGRKQSLSEYPMKNITCLGIDESEAFKGVNWRNPVITKFGIEISKKNIFGKKYKENYYKLKKNLGNKLKSYGNVFSHNPWGEYGNEDHIQVYRVIKELQEKMKFNLWFSNYCGKKSSNLMLKYKSRLDLEYVTLKTNKELSNRIEKLYKKNGCWTWYDDWEWFDEESLIKDRIFDKGNKRLGCSFPVNMIEETLPLKGVSKIFRIFKVKVPGNKKKK